MAMIALVLLSPLAVVLSLRLSYEICIIFNPFGLPWPAPTRIIVRIVSAAIVIGSVAGIAYGFTRRELRVASIVLTIYSALISIPTFLFFFLTIYGDPGPNCIVG